MGQSHAETNHSHTSGNSTESPFPFREAKSRGAEVSGDKFRSRPNFDPPTPEQVRDWEYNGPRSGRANETKLALGAVGVVAALLSFTIWQKYSSAQQPLADGRDTLKPFVFGQNEDEPTQWQALKPERLIKQTSAATRVDEEKVATSQLIPIFEQLESTDAEPTLAEPTLAEPTLGAAAVERTPQRHNPFAFEPQVEKPSSGDRAQSQTTEATPLNFFADETRPASRKDAAPAIGNTTFPTPADAVQAIPVQESAANSPADRHVNPFMKRPEEQSQTVLHSESLPTEHFPAELTPQADPTSLPKFAFTEPDPKSQQEQVPAEVEVEDPFFSAPIETQPEKRPAQELAQADPFSFDAAESTPKPLSLEQPTPVNEPLAELPKLEETPSTLPDKQTEADLSPLEISPLAPLPNFDAPPQQETPQRQDPPQRREPNTPKTLPKIEKPMHLDNAPKQLPAVEAPRFETTPVEKPIEKPTTKLPEPVQSLPKTEVVKSPPTFEPVQTTTAVRLPAAKTPVLTTAEPTPPAEQVHEVQSGENYWTISRSYYGAARYFAALAEYNKHRIPRPERMKPGMIVLIPPVEVLEERYPQLAGSPAAAEETNEPYGFFVDADGTPCYRVGKGDTLTDIAQKHLGRVSRWVQVYGMNRDRLPNANTLKIGTVLKLPTDACQVQVAPAVDNDR